jgi:hypothetical protein
MIAPMRFSYAETFCDPSFLAPLAQAAEDAGYDSFVVPDSLIFPAASDTLYPVDTKGKWTMVETEEGDSGWVQTSSLDLQDGGGGDVTHKRSIDLRAGLGVTFIQQGIRTQGTTLMGADQVPDVYNIGTSAATIDLGGRVLFPYKKYMFGAELLFDASKTLLGGVSYKATTTGLTVTDFNLRGVFAYPTQRKSGMMLLGRLGFRYRGYLVDDYADPMKNPAKIPQETLKAPTLGAAILLPYWMGRYHRLIE